MELEWTRAALGDLDEALEYIVADDQLSAAHVADRVLEAVEYLLEYPNLGRIGRVRGTRELVVSGTPLVIVYRPRLDKVQVFRVLHHARRWNR